MVQIIELFSSPITVLISEIHHLKSYCPIPGNNQAQVGWASKEPDLVKDVAAHCVGVGLNGF